MSQSIAASFTGGFPQRVSAPQESGRFDRVGTQAEQIDFIHDNLIHYGCVDDLLCRWTALP